MKRAQIQLEENMYDQLRRRAFHEKKSIASLIREIIGKEIAPSDRYRSLSMEDFKFISVGRSKQGSLKPVSERHDEALAEAFER